MSSIAEVKLPCRLKQPETCLEEGEGGGGGGGGGAVLQLILTDDLFTDHKRKNKDLGLNN